MSRCPRMIEIVLVLVFKDLQRSPMPGKGESVVVKTMPFARSHTAFGAMTAPMVTCCVGSGPSGPSPVGTWAGVWRGQCCIVSFAGHVKSPAYPTYLRLG